MIDTEKIPANSETHNYYHNLFLFSRIHSALNFCPYRVHYDCFTAALVAGTNRLTHRQRELGAMSLELKKKPRDTLRVNMNVKIKLKLQPFRKEGLFQPAFSQNIHKITHIDRKEYPPLISLTNTKKRFYSQQLLPVGDQYPKDPHIMPPQSRKKLLIQDIVTGPETSLLRSGKSRTMTNSEVKYKTLHDGNIELLTKNDLLLYKKLFGENYLVYSPNFNDSDKMKYLI